MKDRPANVIAGVVGVAVVVGAGAEDVGAAGVAALCRWFEYMYTVNSLQQALELVDVSSL